MVIRKDAYTPEALINAGYPADRVMKWLVDGPRAQPERARLSLNGKKRTKQPTTHYVWGPDVLTLSQ